MNSFFRLTYVAGALLTALLFTSTPSYAGANKMTVAKGFGFGFLQLMMMEDRKLIEKYAKQNGAGDVTVDWVTFRSSDVMFDGLLSETLHVASLGVSGLATIWDKTKGTPQEVKGLVGMNDIPWSLNTSDPNVKSIADFNSRHKIAVPGVKVSIQARMLQMAAMKVWGKSQYDRLDPLTVSMTNPDGVIALLSGAQEIAGHFTAPPFVQKELKAPNVRTLMTSTDILGGDVSFIVLSMPTRFYQRNPKLVEAFMAAFKETTDIINSDKKAAAAECLRLTKDSMPLDEVVDIFENHARFTLDPKGTLSFFHFMNDIGVINKRPTDWKEYMHPVAHNLAGN